MPVQRAGSQWKASAMTATAATFQPRTAASPVADIGQEWVTGLNALSSARATGATGKADAVNGA